MVSSSRCVRNLSRGGGQESKQGGRPAGETCKELIKLIESIAPASLLSSDVYQLHYHILSLSDQLSCCTVLCRPVVWNDYLLILLLRVGDAVHYNTSQELLPLLLQLSARQYFYPTTCSLIACWCLSSLWEWVR